MTEIEKLDYLLMKCDLDFYAKTFFKQETHLP